MNSYKPLLDAIKDDAEKSGRVSDRTASADSISKPLSEHLMSSKFLRGLVSIEAVDDYLKSLHVIIKRFEDANNETVNWKELSKAFARAFPLVQIDFHHPPRQKSPQTAEKTKKDSK